MHRTCIIPRAFFFCFALLLSAAASQAAFTVSGRQILKDGVPFMIKGLCYNPTPIGDNGSKSPNGDYFTSGYSALWDRDLPNIRAMGANVIRIYGWAPTADHSAFLNRCYNNGDHPIFVLVNYWVDPSSDWTNARTVKAIQTNFTNIESRLGGNPAVLGLIVGNEVNQYNGNGSKSAFWSAMNTVAGAIHGVNPKRLVSIAITDALDQMYSADSTMTAIDFWCMQLYRGTSFGSFFNDFAARSARPVVISEYGMDAFDHQANAQYPNNAAYPGDVVTNLFIEMVNNSAVCAGGCLFEYCDEWFRAPGGTDTTQDPGGWQAPFPDGYADEEWFGLFSIALNPQGGPNILTARAGYYELSSVWNATPAPAPAPTPTPTPAPTASNTVVDNSFETYSVGTNTFYAFAYAPAVSGWTYNGNAGIAGNNSGFTSGNPSAPDGTQVAFVQMQGWISVSPSLSAGTYSLSAYTANRANWGGQQTVVVTVDGNPVGQFTGSTNYGLSTTGAFTVAAGTHEIRFTGLATSDATLFLDMITLQAATPVLVSVGSSGFELPDVGSNNFYAFQYQPPVVAGTQAWQFSGNAGVTGNNSGFTASNSAAPEGKQVAFVQMNTGSVSQTLMFPATGNYQLSVSAAQRGNYQQSSQTVLVYIDSTYVGSITPGSTAYQTIQVPFSTTAGNHLLNFVGTATDDSSAFLDAVAITSVP